MLKAFGATFSGALVTLVCHFFTLMFLARLLDAHALGLYFIALMMVFLLKILSDAGIDLAFVKQYQDKNQRGKSCLIFSAFTFRTISCIAVSSLYLLVESTRTISFLNDISDVTALTLTMFWMHACRELILRLLQAERHFSAYATVQVIAALLKALLIFSLFALDDVTVGTVLKVEIFAFVVSIVFAAYSTRGLLRNALKSNLRGGKALLLFGYPLYLNALLALSTEKATQYIVAALGGPVVVAFYGISERLADAGRRLFESFANVYYPSQAENFAQENKKKATTLAEQSILWVAFVICSVIVSFAILRNPLIELIFTADYLSAANAAVGFFGVLLLRSTQILMGYFGVTAGLIFLPIRVSFYSGIVNLALCLVLFKTYGYEGAVAALLATQLLMNILYRHWLAKAGLPIDVKPSLTIVMFCVISVVFIFVMAERFYLTLFIFPLFVFTCLWSHPALATGLKSITEQARLHLRHKAAGKSTQQ
jgi:O-antigen/teichoic acid export membrane protein